MRSVFILSALLPLILACDNPDSDACASVFTASSAAASAFCKTYTTAKSTATTGLPAYVSSYCSTKTAKASSACSCLLSATAATTATTTATTTAATTATTLKTTTTTASASSSTSKVATTSTTSIKTTTTTAVTTTVAGGGTGDGGTTCTVTAYASISSAVKSCTNILLSGISAPASSTISLKSLQTGATVIFAGKTTFGTTENTDFDPIIIGGTDITITAESGAVIDGNGQAYWDGQGSNGGIDKPDHFIVIDDVVNAKITNLYIQNWPTHCFDITGSTGVEISGLTLDNSAGDAANSISSGLPAAHNSDGFDISSTTNMVLSNTIVKNQDDCVAVTSGTNITVTGMTCSGGHGLSIGSVGGKSDNTVTDITFSDSTVTDSENGCRIKTNSGTTGTITNVVYSNIKLSGITVYGIDVQQDYLNGGPTGDPTNGVIIDGVTFTDVTGTCTSAGTDYYILCGSGSCSDFTFSGVSITGGGDTSSCNYPSSGCP